LSPLARLRAAAALAQQHQHQQRRAVGSDALPSPEPSRTGGPSLQAQHHEQQQQPPQRPDLVDRFLSEEALSRRGRLHARKGAAVARFARADGDVGSPEVQVALATERIRDLADHFRAHKKDHHSRRGLQALLNRRRRLLAYLREADFERFCGVLAALGLERDTYARQVRADSYRTGSALGAPAERLPRIALSASAAAARRAGGAKRKRRAAGAKKGGGGGGAGAGAGAAARATGAPMA
jgi:small subunit ribosomal protein S15